MQITSISLGLFSPVAAICLFFTDFEKTLNHEQFTLAFTAILLLSVVGTALAIFLFNKLIKSSGMLFASSVTYLIPIVAILWGVLDGESVSIQHIVGILTVFGGVYLINKRRS